MENKQALENEFVDFGIGANRDRDRDRDRDKDGREGAILPNQFGSNDVFTF